MDTSCSAAASRRRCGRLPILSCGACSAACALLPRKRSQLAPVHCSLLHELRECLLLVCCAVSAWQHAQHVLAGTTRPVAPVKSVLTMGALRAPCGAARGPSHADGCQGALHAHQWRSGEQVERVEGEEGSTGLPVALPALPSAPAPVLSLPAPPNTRALCDEGRPRARGHESAASKSLEVRRELSNQAGSDRVVHLQMLPSCPAPSGWQCLQAVNNSCASSA